MQAFLKNLASAKGAVEAASRPDRLPIDLIDTRPQVRQQFLGLDELAAEIRASGGVQVALIVVPRRDKPGRYWLVAGERRLRAAPLAGFDEVPVDVRSADLTSEEIDTIQIAENREQRALTLYDEVVSVAAHIKQHGMDGAAKRWGRSEPWLIKRAKTAEFDERLLALLRDQVVVDMELLHSTAQLLKTDPAAGERLIAQLQAGQGATRDEVRRAVGAAKGRGRVTLLTEHAEIDGGADDDAAGDDAGDDAGDGYDDADAGVDAGADAGDESDADSASADDAGGDADEAARPAKAKTKAAAKKPPAKKAAAKKLLSKAAAKKAAQKAAAERREAPVPDLASAKRALEDLRAEAMAVGERARLHTLKLRRALLDAGATSPDADWAMWVAFCDATLPFLAGLEDPKAARLFVATLHEKVKKAEPMSLWKLLHPALPGEKASDPGAAREEAPARPDDWSL